MTRRQLWLSAFACLALCAFAPAAVGKPMFRGRIGGALGLFPSLSPNNYFSPDVASGALTPVVYHGGSVMAGGITVHTIFWDGGTDPFQGSPGAGIPTYEGMVKQFFTDVATASGTTGNVFSVLPQFAEGLTPGHITKGKYAISYNASTDSIDDHQAYPSKTDQCASAQDATTCITDAQVRAEVSRVIKSTGGTRGLHNLWYVFLPPDVDECILPGVCGTNAFGGYHSLSNVGGQTIYAITIDPIIETRRANNPGDDPQGFPDAELTVDIAAHETAEAMTDPQGVGYMDPNGNEIGDKCEFGPQFGDPLGFASDGSPFNQVINGHQYLIQEMWANHDNQGNPDCVQRTTTTKDDLPLPQANLTQYSSTIKGNTETNTSGIPVSVTLLRSAPDGSPVEVAHASTTTAADGSWSVSIAPHAVGDDRDEIDVDYNNDNPGPGVPAQPHQVILTGNGGNPFGEAGWMGWFDMDNGSAATNSSLTVGPCFQTGVLTGSPASVFTVPLTDFCSTQLDTATAPAAITSSDAVTWTSLDNRAFQDPNAPSPNPAGGLVNLTVPVGEPNSVSTFVSPLIFAPGGFPSCTGDLEAQTVTCTGLVPGATYTLTDGSEHGSGAADGSGAVSVPMAIKGGDSVALSNGSRTLTTLHVAHLKVKITGEQTVLSGGSCQADNYYGPPLTSPPLSAAAGFPTAFVGGGALTGEICPSSGDATGLPTATIGQTDELSGGQTQTEVPDIEDTSPMEGEIVYGNFVALAESGLPGPNNTVTPTDSTSTIALSVAPAGGGSPVFTSPNVDTANGVSVTGLAPGSYRATWTLSDANGDTRTVTTRFIEQPGAQGQQGPPGPPGPRGRRGPRGPKPKVSCKLVHHGTKIRCKVTFPKHHKTKGTLQMRIARGGHVAALGKARVRNGAATVTLRELRRLTHGAWTITLVLSQSHRAPSTTSMRLRMA